MYRIAACAAAAAFAAVSADADDQVAAQASRSEEIIVHGTPLSDSTAPNMTETLSADEIARSVSAFNTEDVLKYLPDIFVRKRHVGDTQAPMTTRTSGVGSSARSLVYADGFLLSALIGNNNSTASPRWGMVAPEEIARIDVLYGPFSAAYPGSSIGAVVNIITRMPDRFEAGAKVAASWQSFGQYATRDTYPAYEGAAIVGDRAGTVAWWLSVNHLVSNGQPLSFVTVARPTAPSSSGILATGAIPDLNRTGAAIAVIGAGGLEHHIQDNVTAKVAVDVGPSWTASYMAGYFRNDDQAHGETYLRNAAGDPVYSGTLNLNGGTVTVPASAFSNAVYTLAEDHWMHGLALSSNTGADWDVDVRASLYSFAHDTQRTPTGALPGASSGGAGALVDMAGTGWYTLDAKAIWRAGAQELSGGLHRDANRLINNRTTVADWTASETGLLAATAHGKTDTNALWLQDAWRMETVTLTVGGRLESWRAFDGYNFSATPALSVSQPQLESVKFSPKGSLAWRPADDWTFTANLGVAYRFPTVSELYQAIATGVTLTVPNPNLRPERAISSELDAERKFSSGHVRLSLFQENMADALISQTAPLVSGSTTLFNYVQNIDNTRARGAELSGAIDDLGVRGVSVSGSVTYVDARITKDAGFAAAVDKRLPQVPAWRGTIVATYVPDARWSFTAALRASTRVYATADNSDPITHTYQGFDGYVVADARVVYRIQDQWSLAASVENIGDRKYFVFHPFPQRTFAMEVKYSY